MYEALVDLSVLLSVLLIAILYRTRHWWVPGGIVFACAVALTAMSRPNITLGVIVLYGVVVLLVTRKLYSRHCERAASEAD